MRIYVCLKFGILFEFYLFIFMFEIIYCNEDYLKYIVYFFLIYIKWFQFFILIMGFFIGY